MWTGIEIVAGVEGVVAEKLESFAVKLVDARTGGDIDDRARVAAVLRRERGVVHLEFRQRVNRRLEGDLVLHGIV